MKLYDISIIAMLLWYNTIKHIE